MKKELAPKYNHLEVESNKYQGWVDAGFFTAGDKSKDPYCIVIPPPNVTGKLHLGHAWDTTLQDIIARFKRLQGYDMLWLSGMDHAGIATQAKVDERLKAEGINRYDLGREKFLERAWEWKEEYAGFIRQQWAKMGLSLDYTRERFTLDEGLNKVVNKVFTDLYNDGLIYQGFRIINWDPQAKTALSNIEVIHKEVEGAFYTFKYQVVGSDKTIDVATTRPETMFGDVCVVVNPNDEMYQELHQSFVVNPANGQEIPIICDEYVEIGFGTGAMKCTPAHDPNDFMLAEKHNLERPICMNPDGTMNQLAGEFEGLDRFDCRKKLVKRIEEEGNLVKIEKHLHQVGHSERTDCIVEPYLSKQWFVKMKPLAQEVLKFQNTDQGINFTPERFGNIFSQWLENIEDWCISRQLWWGHRIPVYYHNETGELVVGNPPKDIENYYQDEDVLDTWFSSALWPFSTLGWPDDCEDFKRFYPTNCLVTGYDIIFFWVARMAFQARYFTNSVPFKDCLIHGLVRDSQGRKMSKSLGNGVDPMEIIEKYGVDSLRFFLTTNSTPGMDLRYSEEKVESSWNFINKIYNASKFVIMNMDEYEKVKLQDLKLNFIDSWIIQRMDKVLDSITHNMERYEFALVGNELYNFVWDDFCNNYIELSKSGINSGNKEVKNATVNTLVLVLTNICKLLHPFMPFVTEEIFQQFEDSSICVSQWPTNTGINNELDYKKTTQVIEVISAIRQIKTQYNVKPSTVLDFNLKDLNNNVIEFDNNVSEMVLKVAKGNWNKELIIGECAIINTDSVSVSVLLNDLIDVTLEIEKLTKEVTRLTQEIKRAQGMLSNPNFINKAPADKVAAEEEKLENYKTQLELAKEQLKSFK